VMVLFLFVIMMMDINMDEVRQGFWKHFPLAAGIGALIALQMGFVLMGGFRLTDGPQTPEVLAAQANNTKALGVLLYTQYIYPMEVAAVLLLVGIVAAIALTLRERKDSKHVDAGDQVRVKARDRMAIIKMNATKIEAPRVDSATTIESDASQTTAAVNAGGKA
jgi:NADH-quinone oxidoreductase subunit J